MASSCLAPSGISNATRWDLFSAAHEYGPVAQFRLANVVFNLVSHPDGIQQVLQGNNHNYIKGEFFDPVRQMAGDGLFASEGAHWLRQRRLMQPAFHRQRIAGFAETMVRQTELMLRTMGSTRQLRRAC